MMQNCVECTFHKGWRGHREGVTVALTPSRALELQRQKIVSITSTGQTVLSGLGFALPREQAEAKPAAKPATPRKKAAPKKKPAAKVEPAETNEPQLEPDDK